MTPVHFAFAGLVFAGFAALWRLLVGPTLADRIIALDLALIALMAGIAIDGANRDDTTWLNLLIVIAIIGFTATVATTRFMEHKGPIDALDDGAAENTAAGAADGAGAGDGAGDGAGVGGDADAEATS